MTPEQIQTVLVDTEIGLAEKGAYCILAFVLDGEGSFGDIAAESAQQVPFLNTALKRLRLRGYITFHNDRYQVL